MPKTMKTLRGRIESNLPQPPKTDVGRGLRKIVLNPTSQGLLVSLVFGMVSSLHPMSFLMIFILVSLICPSHKHGQYTVGLIASLHSCCTVRMCTTPQDQAAGPGRATEVVTYNYGIAL